MRHKENEPCSFVDVPPLDVKSHRTLGIEARMVRVSPIGGSWLPLHDPVVILPTKTSDELHSERVDCPRICQSRQRSNSCAVVLERPQSFAFRLLSTATHTNPFSNSFLSARRPLEPNFGGTRLQYDYIFEHGFASIDGALLVFPCGEHRKC
jgi:hypothetical protein